MELYLIYSDRYNRSLISIVDDFDKAKIIANDNDGVIEEVLVDIKTGKLESVGVYDQYGKCVEKDD